MKAEEDPLYPGTMRRHAAALCSLTVMILLSGLLTGAPVGAAENPAAVGEWSEVMGWPFIPIHASIDQDGNVLTYGGKGAGGTNDEFNIDVWTPSAGAGEAAHVTSTHGLGTNLFCSFALSSPDGRGSIMLGGTVSGARGLPDFVARYRDGELTDFPAMHYPRWYGTGTTLPDGRILMQGGTPLADDQENAIDTAEVYSEEQGWVELTGTTPSGVWETGWWYPKSFVTPAGKVWNLANQDMYYLNPNGAGNVEMIGSYNETANIGGTSSAVNFAPGLILQVRPKSNDLRPQL